MDTHFSRLLETNTPKFSDTVINGFAYYQLQKENVEAYLNAIMTSSAGTLPAELEYLGYESVTPREEFMEITRMRDNSHQYEMSNSSHYMMKFNFSFRGELLPPRYMYIPYIERGNQIYFSGTKYHICSVLSDRVIQPTETNVFIKLLKDKIIFERNFHTVVINGRNEVMQVIWATIYRADRNVNKNKTAGQITTTAVTSTVHYLLCKYGVNRLFSKFLGFRPVIGNSEINTNNYPTDKWVICESSGKIPNTWKGDQYTRHNIKLAIPIDHWSILTSNIIGGLFYILDNFPEHIDISMLDNGDAWMVLLGHIIFSGTYTHDRLYRGIREHFESLDSYVDAIIKKQLAESGHDINDFFELLILILENFNQWVFHHREYTNTINNKYLDVLYYILYDLSSGMFRANFDLFKYSIKRDLTRKVVLDILNKNMSYKKIYGLVKTTKPNISMMVTEYSGDNYYTKITSHMVLQESGNGVHRAKRNTLPSTCINLTGSDLALGSILFIPKATPTSRVRLNPFTVIDHNTGVIQMSKDIEDTVNKLDVLLQGKDVELKPTMVYIDSDEIKIDE